MVFHKSSKPLLPVLILVDFGGREIISQFKTVIFDDFYWQFLNVYDFGMKTYTLEAITEITTKDTGNDRSTFLQHLDKPMMRPENRVAFVLPISSAWRQSESKSMWCINFLMLQTQNYS